MSRFETCYLHIGGQKTGSTSIQRACHDNVALLEAAGLCYPMLDRINHVGMVAALGRGEDGRARLVGPFATQFEAALTASRASRLLVSYEMFIALDADQIATLLGLLRGLARKVVVVAYVFHPG